MRTALPALLTQAAVVWRAAVRVSSAGVDRRDDWEHPERVAEHRCAVQFNASTESVDNRDVQKVTATLFLPPEAGVDGTQRVTVDGRWFLVTGIPRLVLHHLTGAPHHFEVSIRAAEG